MFWQLLFPCILLFSLVDGFISNMTYPATLPLLLKDILIVITIFFFVIEGHIGRKIEVVKSRFGMNAWLCALGLLVLGVFQLFNPASPSLTVGLLGFKVAFLYWTLAFLGYHYAVSTDRIVKLFRVIVYLSIPINAYGIYQYIKGPEVLEKMGAGFTRAVVIANIEGLPALKSFLRVSSTFASTGQYSDFLVIVIILCIGLMMVKQRRWERWLVMACMLLSFVAILACGSRSRFVMLILSLGVFFILCRRARVILLSALISGICLYFAFDWLGGAVVKRYESLKKLSYVQERTFSTTVDMFLLNLERNPMGRGMGTASAASRHLAKFESVDYAFIENQITKVQAEMGLAGVLLFYLFFVFLTMRWLSVWLRSPMDESTYFIVMALSAYCFVTFFVGGIFFLIDSPPISIFLWSLVGIAARLSGLSGEPDPKSATAPMKFDYTHFVQPGLPKAQRLPRNPRQP